MPRKRPPQLNPAAVDAVLGLPADWRKLIPPQRKIAVIGKASDSMLLAPYDDPSWQIWVLNDTPVRAEVPRWDVLFEMHEHTAEQRAEQPAHYAWLRQRCGKPIFMHPDNVSDEFPDAVSYPLEEMKARFRDYFTCTAAYQLALALACEPTEIGIWGVNMALDGEYQTQRPSVEYFLGLADTQLGTKNVHVPPQSDLLKTLVGYGRNHPMLVKWSARMKDITGRKSQCEDTMRKAELEAAFLEGARQDMDYWRQHISSTRAKA